MRALGVVVYLKALAIFGVSFFVILPESVSADAFEDAQRALERLRQNCYPDIDAEHLVTPEILVDGVVVEVGIGADGGTRAYIVSPEHLACDGKSAGLCGSRGCQIRIFAEDDAFSYVGWSPEVFSFNENVFLLLPHSGWVCDEVPNSSPCFSVLFWNDASQKFSYRK